MKPHPRIRRTIKWGGEAASVLLLAVWIRSGWSFVCLKSASGHWVSITCGAVGIGRTDDVARGAELLFEWKSERGCRIDPWFSGYDVRVRWAIFTPLWIPLAGVVLAASTAWRLDALARRRARVGACPKCSYNRTGLAPGSVCPECGAAAPAASSP